MLIKLFLVSFILVLTRPAQAQERCAVTYGGFAGYHAPLWAAKDLGIFTKHGLNCDPVMLAGSARGMQALIAGNTQFALADATGPVTALYQGADLVIIASALNKFPFSLASQKEITQPSQLAGKKVSISSFGGATEWAMNLALKEWNIPRESVTLLASGSGANRLLALASKAVDAAVVAPPESGEAARRGMNLLAHFSDLKANFPMATVVVRREYLQKNRDSVKRFLQAYSEAVALFKTNRARSIAVYEKRLKQLDAKIIDETYGYFAPKFFLPPRVPLDGARYTMELVAQRAATPGKTEPAVEKFVDNSIVDELVRDGFYKTLPAAK